MLQITQVRVRKIHSEAKSEGKGRVLAYASVTFADAFVVHDIKVIEKADGKILVAMPSRKGADNQWHDICHPIHAEARAELEKAVLDEFHRV